MKNLILIFLTFFTVNSWALQDVDKQDLSEINLIKNPGFEQALSGWSTYADAAGVTPVDCTGGTANLTFVKSTTNPISQTTSAILTKDAANRQGQGISYLATLPSAVGTNSTRKSYLVSFAYRINSGTYSGGSASTDSDQEVYVYDVTNGTLLYPDNIKVDQSSTGTYVYNGQFQLPENSTSLRVCIHTATTSASSYSLKIDDVKLRLNPLIGYQVTDYTGLVSAQVSSAGVVSQENKDFISGNCAVTATSTFTCTLNSGYFVNPPNCVATLTGLGAATAEISVQSTSSSQVVIRTGSSAGGAASFNFFLACQKSELDSGFAVKMDQTNFGTTSFDANPSAGFGTSTNKVAFYYRIGEKLYADGSFTSGTVAGSLATLTIPYGTIDSNKVGLSNTSANAGPIVGYWVANGSGNQAGPLILALGTSNTLIYFGEYALANPNVPKNGNSIIASTSVVTYHFEVPITGWTQNQNVPLIVGGVTTKSASTDLFNRARVTCGNTGSTVISQGGGSWISVANGASAGLCTLTFTGFSAEPQCDCQPIAATSTSKNGCDIITISSTTMTVGRVAAGAATNGDILIKCSGAR